MANEPIDIFSQAEPSGAPLPPPPGPATGGQIPSAPGVGPQPMQVTPQVAPTAQQQALNAVEEQELFGQDKMSGKQIAIVIIVGIIVLAALGGGGYFVYRGLTTTNQGNENTNAVTNTNGRVNQNTNSTNTNTTVPPVNTNTSVNTNTQVNTNTSVNSNTSVNTNTGTNTNASADPDNDGLTNAQEATYGTDVNNPDTDGDGFLDGEEVQNGYNPLGPGRL